MLAFTAKLVQKAALWVHLWNYSCALDPSSCELVLCMFVTKRTVILSQQSLLLTSTPDSAILAKSKEIAGS